jgi:hypothetical protein
MKPYFQREIPTVRFPCGQRDKSQGHLWTWYNHCLDCRDIKCRAWSCWFCNFREDYIRHHRTATWRANTAAAHPFISKEPA